VTGESRFFPLPALGSNFQSSPSDFRIVETPLPRLGFVMRFILCLLLALAFPAAAAEKPNVLFISIDDLNDWTGKMKGHPQAVTPNLDKLADSGMLFTNTHCAAPACNPSRAALMTGIRPSTSGIYTNPEPWRQSPVLKDAKTIPQWFRDHGYSVFGSGKIYHGSFPDPPSWDFYWPDQKKNKPGDPKPEGLPLNGIPKTAHFDWGPHPNPTEEMGDWQVAEWVRGQLQKEHDKPFFVACGFYRPHLPWYAPEEYFEKFPLDEIDLPDVLENDLADIPAAGVKIAKPDGDHANVVQHQQWKKAVQGYLACIHFVDDCVGHVIDGLESSPHADNTIVVLWSDHGWHLGEKEHWRKFALWDEATRVQMMWRVPGVTEAGSNSNNAVNLLDIYPTLTELAGIPSNPAVEGNSLATMLRDPSVRKSEPTLTTHGFQNHALRDQRWRYIRYADGSEELYDHKNDPNEYTNLAGKKKSAEQITRLKRFLPEVNADPLRASGKRGKNKKP
jgi:arylsulfatase A-like enzyme